MKKKSMMWSWSLNHHITYHPSAIIRMVILFKGELWTDTQHFWSFWSMLEEKSQWICINYSKIVSRFNNLVHTCQFNNNIKEQFRTELTGQETHVSINRIVEQAIRKEQWIFLIINWLHCNIWLNGSTYNLILFNGTWVWRMVYNLAHWSWLTKLSRPTFYFSFSVKT